MNNDVKAYVVCHSLITYSFNWKSFSACLPVPFPPPPKKTTWTFLLTHSLTHSLTYLLTHSFTCKSFSGRLSAPTFLLSPFEKKNKKQKNL